MHPIQKGDLSVAMLIATFLRCGFVVLKPISEMHRYDLVIDRGSGFERVQCKTGRLRKGAVAFNAYSSMAHHGGGRKGYRGEADVFGVYCSETDTCYIVPVGDVGETEAKLRVDKSKNAQTKGVRLAETYAV